MFANKKGVKSRFFIGRSGKYNCPSHSRSKDCLSLISKEHEVELLPIEDAKKYDETFFLIEGVGVDYLSSSSKKISISYMTDFVGSIKSYYEKVDHILMASKSFVTEHDCDWDGVPNPSDKNLYLGDVKHDIMIDRSHVLEKYKIQKNKKLALVIFPRNRDKSKTDLSKIYSLLRNSDYSIIVKTRGKDPVNSEKLRGDYYFEDFSWFPHTTMELISISDVVINFGSTAIEECVRLKKPVINFAIKPFNLPLKFLYEYQFCKNFGFDVVESEFLDSISFFENELLEESFNKCIEDHFPDHGKNSSENVLNYFKLI